MVTSEKVFEKAKKFDDKGIFGIGSDEMTKDEFKNYLKEKNFTIHDKNLIIISLKFSKTL